MWSPSRTGSSRSRFLLWRRIHTAQLAVLARSTGELHSSLNDKPPPVLISSLPSSLCLLDCWWRADTQVRNGGKFPFKTFPIHFLWSPPVPLLRTSLPHSHASWAACGWDGGGVCVDSYWCRGQRRNRGGCSVLLDGPQVPDVTFFNGIIMTVSRLPLALSLEVMHTM